jgi:carbamoyl-phosphate synthase large subunit
MAVTVLVSGAGGAAAISTIKALRSGGFDGRIIATDAEPLSAGLYLADGFRVVPKAKDPAFFPAVRKLIEDERIGVIIPTSGFDIYEFARKKPELEAMGVVVAMSDSDAMSTCENKWEFYLKTQGAFPLPETGGDPATWTRFPCFVKPIFGKGSRGTHRCATREELEYHTRDTKDLLIQEYLPGEEYTVDVLSDLAGAPILAVPRARLETKGASRPRGACSATRRWSGSASTWRGTSASRGRRACSSSATWRGGPNSWRSTPASEGAASSRPSPASTFRCCCCS